MLYIHTVHSRVKTYFISWKQFLGKFLNSFHVQIIFLIFMPFFDNINTDSRFWCPFILACLTRKPWGEVDTAQYSLLQFLKNSIFDECFDISVRKRIIQEFLLRTSTSVTLHGILLVNKINCKNRIHYWNTVSQLLPMRRCCMDCCLAIFLL